MTLTLITVNYNGADDTLRLLSSLQHQTDADFDCIVVDNDSAEEDRARIGSALATTALSADIIYSERNLGFSGGNNIGIRKALAQGSEWIVLINNDTVVDTTFIARLRASLPSHPAVVGIALNEGTRTVYAGRVSWLTPTLSHLTASVGPSDEATYAIGAGVAAHRHVFETVGLLDEAYFLYFEDAEFSVRARRAGVPVLFITDPVIRHAVSGTTKSLGSPLLLRYHYRNMIRFNRSHAPVPARLALPLVLAWVTLKQCLKLCAGRATAQSTAILAGIRDGLLDRSGSVTRRPVIAFECESLEDESWGVARQVRGLMTTFTQLPDVRRSYDIIAYFKSRIPDEEWTRQPHVKTVLLRPFPWLPASFSLYFYVFFPIRVWFDRPAVTYIANYMLPLIWHGRSIVMLTEDVWHEMHGSALPFKYRLAYRIFASWAAKRATRIMAISHASARAVAELFGIPSGRICVNELAVSPPAHTSAEAGDYVLYVAQGLPRRHLRETILAFTAIAPKLPGLTLRAIGPDKYQPPVIADMVRDANATLCRTGVIWTERVTDAELARLYAGARSLVYVSDMEAFGLPPVEALSYGVPSVLKDEPVHRELFGDLAFYTAEGTADGIARALERSLTDTAHRERIRASATSVVSRYTWGAHATRMLSIIRSIL